jgi:bifunctional non-homologous end joining protein LigD
VKSRSNASSTGSRKSSTSAAGTRRASASAGDATAARAASDVVEQLARIERDGGDGILRLEDGVTLAVSSLGKPFFPKEGVTKGGLMRYYARVAPVLLPAIAGRPLALKRYPDGITGASFYQHDPGERTPEGVRTATVHTELGRDELRLIGGDLATLLYTVQLGTIAVNAWHSRIGSIDTPDYTVLDLDPGPRVAFRKVVEVARLVRQELAALGLDGVPKTSGSRGIHILVPLPEGTSYETSAELAERVAMRVVAANPALATVERALASRPKGSVYVDHMQNAHGKTLASVFSARARAGALVSTPLSWRQVTPTLDPARFTVASVPRERARLGTRWTTGMAVENRLEPMQPG